MDNSALLKAVRLEAQKASRRTKAYTSRGLYSEDFDKLKHQMNIINPSGWKNPFAVSKDFSTSILEKKLNYYKKYNDKFELFSEARKKAKEYGITVTKYTQKKEKENYQIKFAEEYGSGIIGKLWQMEKKGLVTKDEIINSLWNTAHKKDLTYSEMKKLLAIFKNEKANSIILNGE